MKQQKDGRQFGHTEIAGPLTFWSSSILQCVDRASHLSQQWWVYVQGSDVEKHGMWWDFSLCCASPSLLCALHRSHTQTALLLDGLQLVGADGLCDQIQLLTHGLTAVCYANVRDVSAPDVVPLLSFHGVVWTEPAALHLVQNKNRGRRRHSGIKDWRRWRLLKVWAEMSPSM